MAVLCNWSPPRVSQLVVDADLMVPNPYTIYAYIIKAFPDSDLLLRNAAGNSSMKLRAGIDSPEFSYGLRVNRILEISTSHSVAFPNGIKVDTIDDNVAGSISILEDIVLNTSKTLTADAILTDGISERTGSANISLNSKLLVDNIGEKTASHGIVFDDDIQAQEDFEAMLTQDYLSADDGTVVRWTSASEETAVNPGLSPGVVIKTVTVPAEYADPNCSFRVLYSHKTTSAIQGRCRVAINGIPVGAGIISDTTYEDSSEVVTGVTAGDTIDIMSWSESGSDLTAYVKDFIVKSADSIYHPVGASPTWT